MHLHEEKRNMFKLIWRFLILIVTVYGIYGVIYNNKDPIYELCYVSRFILQSLIFNYYS